MKKIVILVCALLLAGVVAAPVQAKQAPYSGATFLALSARYVTDLGVGGGIGYQFRASGVMLVGMVTYDQQNGVAGTTPFRVGCTTYQVPFATSSTGHRGAEFLVIIPISKRASSK